MPYVICGACDLSTYSAALWASTDECPRCGVALPSARRTEWLAVALVEQIVDGSANGDERYGAATDGGHA